MYLKSNTKITSNPLSLFFSYAHRDQQLRDQLDVHLSFLKRVDRIMTWHDRIIRPGEEWKNKTDEKLNQADIILLLISPAFAKSDYCYDIEMMRAMERHERGEAVVIPVILRPTSNWQDSPFGKLQALPADNKAVTSWRNRDAAFKAVADGIRSIIDGRQSSSFFEDVGALIRIETKVVASEAQSFTKYLPEVFGGNAIEEGWAPFVTGMAIPRNNPIQPGFKLARDAEQAEPSEDDIKALMTRLGRYLNTFLVVEGKYLHVSLSPYDAYGGLPEPLQHTELGRDLLAQDVVLKHYTAQLLHPDTNQGKAFWNRMDELGVTDESLESCLRVWILPGEAKVKENGQANDYFHVDIEQFNLRVLCESEYETLNKIQDRKGMPSKVLPIKVHEEVVEVFKDLILPKIYEEVNRGNRFSILRQIYSVMIFSAWYEKSNLGPALKQSGFLNSNDVEKYQLNTVGDDAIKMKDQYLRMFEEGVWQYTKAVFDDERKEMKRKVYVVGGICL